MTREPRQEMRRDIHAGTSMWETGRMVRGIVLECWWDDIGKKVFF
jgi:hypothetical protein